MRPPFIRVLPAEVARYKPQGAILAAHIRFRTETENHARQRDAEGYWVWPASLVELAHETGLSVRGVRTGLANLGNAVVATQYEQGSNQLHAYRMAAEETRADLPVGENDTVPDQPVVENDKPPCRKRQATVSKKASVLPIENGEKGGERARENGQRTADPTSFEVWETHPPDSHGNPQTPTRDPSPAPDGAVSLDEKRFRDLCAKAPAEPPQRQCATHAHWEGDHSCRTCGSDRTAYRNWHGSVIRVLGELALLRDNTSVPGLGMQVARARQRRLAVLDALGLSRTRAGEAA